MLNCSLPADWDHVHLPCTDSTMLRLRHDDLWLRPAPYMLLTTGFIGTADSRKTICLVVGILMAVVYVALQFCNRINR